MIGYDPEKDAENPSGSVFCANGAGFYVSWDRVKEYMHGKAASKGLLQVKIHQRERTGPAFHLHRRNGCHRTK